MDNLTDRKAELRNAMKRRGYNEIDVDTLVKLSCDILLAEPTTIGQQVVITSAKRITNSTNGNPRLELVLATENGPLKLRTPSDAGWIYALPSASDLAEVEAFAKWHRTPTGRYVLDSLEV